MDSFRLITMKGIRMKSSKPFSLINGWINVFTVMVLAVSCTTNPNQALPPQSQDVQSVIELDQPSVPGQIGQLVKVLEDTNSTLKASENRAIGGDNILDGLFERPFTSRSMAYQPDVDILTASLYVDDDFFYFSIQLAGLAEKSQSLTALYGIEFDTNKDGRGEKLILARNPGRDWSNSGVEIYTDLNSDVGGKIPMTAETGFKGDGYENKVNAENKDPSAFARVSETQPSTVEIAINRKLLNDPKEFLWSAWADGGIQDTSKFDYNDAFGPSQAGSPIKTSADFPVKALFSLDNTCRAAYGFTSAINIPGMCTSVQLKEPVTPVPGRPVIIT